MKLPIKIILGISIIFMINIYPQSTSCDDCPAPEVVIYGVQMNVPQPPPDDSAGEYTTPQSQKALLDWIALGDAMVPMAQISSSDPEKDCVQWLDGTMAQELAANPDTNVIIHQQNFSTGDIPSGGAVAGVDFIIWSSIDSSGGQYHFHVYLEDANSRTRIASGEADFSDPNESQTAAKNAIAQMMPIFDKIRTYQKNMRNLGGDDVAINAKIYIIPSKGDMNGGETIPVVFQVKDCDGTPLSNRWVKIKATNGHFDKDSVETDGSGKSTANFTANNVKNIANITGIYYPYFTTSRKTKGAWGDTTVNINYTPVRNWVLNIKENYLRTDNYHDKNNFTISYGTETIRSDAEVTQFVTGDFKDSSITIDGIIGGKGSSTLWGSRNSVSSSPDLYENDNYTTNAEVASSEDFTFSIGLDDFIQYGEYNGIGFTSELLLYETQGWHLFEAGSSVSPSPFSFDTTVIFDESPDTYHIFTVGPNNIDGGNNSTWQRSDSGFIFRGNYIYDTTITKSDDPNYEEKYHNEEHVTVNVKPYNNVTGVKSPFEIALPTEYKLFQNFPNPFNPTTTIEYQIPKEGLVSIKIYDILGNQIAVLVNQEKPAGHYIIKFNGERFSSGIYFCKLESGNFIEIKKLVLLK